MLSPLRNRFGIPGVISVIALVFAMLGGAYAASNAGDGKATASAKKAKKGPRGPRGKTGPAGPAGPQGPAGANGKDGANGVNGLDGESVTQQSASAAECSGVAGGVKYTLDGTTTKVCSGKNGTNGAAGATGPEGPAGATGPEGPEGKPWTPDNELPPGASLTGTWSFGRVVKAAVPTEFPPFEEPLYVPISFPIPLKEGISETKIHYITKNNLERVGDVGEEQEIPSTECLGTAASPKANPGHLCIYAGEEAAYGVEGAWLLVGNTHPNGDEPGGGPTGTILNVWVLTEKAFAYGSWAVTAPPTS